MGLIPWNPWQELESLNHRLSRVLDDSLQSSKPEQSRWLPDVDIHETADKFTITADLPGIDKKDINIAIEGGSLVISGERKYEKEEKSENTHRIERSFGHFVRSFSLPTYVNTTDIKAKMENGVLTVELPKQEGVKPKSITIE